MCTGRRRAGASAATGCTDRARGSDPGPGNARAGLRGRRHLRLRARVPRPELFIQEGPRGAAWARGLGVQGLRRGGGPGLTHQRAEGHDAEQPLQEDAETVHERAALAAARPGRGGGGPDRQPAARVPRGALHDGAGGGAGSPRSSQPRCLRGPRREPEPEPEPGARSPSRHRRPAADSAPRVTRRLRSQRPIGPARRGGGPWPLGRSPRGAGLRPGRGAGREFRAQVGPGEPGAQTREWENGPGITSSTSEGQEQGRSVTQFFFPSTINPSLPAGFIQNAPGFPLRFQFRRPETGPNHCIFRKAASVILKLLLRKTTHGSARRLEPSYASFYLPRSDRCLGHRPILRVTSQPWSPFFFFSAKCNLNCHFNPVAFT